jgi:hypothetical protein
MDFNKLSAIIERGTKEELAAFCAENKLVVQDGVVKPVDKEHAKSMIEYWDKRQLVRKIQLNS